MGERMRRSLRRAVTVLAVLVGSALVVLLAAGDRLLGDRVFTDGSALVDRAIWEGAARFAWKDTGPLPEPLGGPDGEASPAFGSGHPDLYFCRKTEDHWDLWRSPWTPDGHGRPEPLFELNTGRNERDPVLFRGGRLLVFSSDRPGGRGGYDLWAAEVTADGFQEPRNLGTKLNSTADDRAPTSDTFGRRMVFASNRLAVDRVSFDLFESESVGGRWSEPALIHALQTEDDGESRAPALSPDGRFLVFASDREGGAGGYDLYRTVRYDGQWRKPVSMTELNTEADETDAAFSPEGTAIVFARTRLDGDGFTMNLHQAERRELISLNDGQSDLWSKLLILLAGILLALLLSYLTLFWHGIHPFIKFVIMSLLVHLLVLLYMQGQRLPAPEFGGSGEQSFVVSFIPSADDGESEAGGEAAQGDKVAPTQRGFAQPSARQTERPAPTSPASAPSQSMVAARAATESTREATRDAQAPSRATTDAASRALAEANTADAQDAQERKAGSDAAPATAVAGAATTAASRASVNPSSERAASAAPATATANPGAMGADRAMSTGRTGRPNVAQATPGGAGPVSRATGAPAPRAFAKNAREAGQRKSASDAPGASIVADASATPANRLESGTGQPAPTATPRRPVAAGEGVAAPAPGALVARRDAGVSAPSPASASRGALARAARPSPRIGGRAADGGARS
ncbi:MAG: hypothetical protein CMJ83_11245, partial [Planctomycetes bacterium]|nr:hypothetical protein [Planctomycetota bacterium]